MKQVLLQRGWQNLDATLGIIAIKGVEHVPLFTLEDPPRKGYVETCIPANKYLCAPFTGTKFANVYEVKDVVNRSAILMHWGNYSHETTGCILIGFSAGFNEKHGPCVLSSRLAFNYFKEIIGENKFELHIFDKGNN